MKNTYVVEALGKIQDLTIPTSTQQYPLGAVFVMEDSDAKTIKKYMYVKAHDTLAANGVYLVQSGGVSAAEVVTAATVDTSASKDVYYYNLPCVAEVAFTANYYGFVCIQGTTTVSVDGSVTDQHALKLMDAAATMTTEGATTVTIYTAAIARAARTGAGTLSVELIGNDKQAVQFTAS